MKRNLLLAAVAVLVALAAVEITLRTFTRFPVTERSNRRQHDQLLYTLDPFLADVNREGFRNTDVYRGEDIVAIGDSHTYGSNVPPSKSWPEQLQRRLDRGVYNMGVPSYHLYSYVYLIEQIIQEHPERIVVAVYPSSDFSFYVCRTLDLDYWRRRIRRHPELTNQACKDRNIPSSGEPVWWKRMVRRTAAGDLLDVTLWDPYLLPALLNLREFFHRRDRKASRSYVRLERHGSVMRVPHIAFHSRWKKVNRDRKIVAESLGNARHLLDALARKSRKHNVPIQFLLLPSRERMIYESTRAPAEQLPSIAVRAGRKEARLTRALEAILRDRCFPSVDVTGELLEAFKRSFRQGNPLYPPGDSHPDERGYDIYARQAERLVTGPPRTPGCDPSPTDSGTRRTDST